MDAPTALAPADRLRLLSPVWAHLSERVVTRAAGCELWDADGNRVLDFTAGIGVASTGHCHPRVVQAIRQQAGELIFAQVNCVISEATLRLAETLLPIMPPRLDCFFFCSTGVEAIEAAVKLAKQATGRPGVIAFTGSFHGRTHLGMALTASKTLYRAGYQPLPAGVSFVRYPYAYRYGVSEDEITVRCLQELDEVLHQQAAPRDTGMILIEPVLGEGGYVPAPDAFLRGLRERCDRHGMLLAYDEIQCGNGRTGDWWAHQRSGAFPDLLITAKGLGSGMPIAALAAPRTLMERWPTGSHGSTYGGGNAVVAAAAVATLQVIEQEGLRDNAVAMGARLRDGLVALQRQHACIGDVRGRGLMVATEIIDPVRTQALVQACLRRGLMLLSCGYDRNVIRWIPPLVVSATEIDEALATFAEAIAETV